LVSLKAEKADICNDVVKFRFSKKAKRYESPSFPFKSSTELLIKTRHYSGEGNGSRRIDRRRATHNEVERRRRDTINAWIMQLGKDFLRNGRITQCPRAKCFFLIWP
jgi:hypothetical protein